MCETRTDAGTLSCYEQLAILAGVIARCFGSVVSYADPVHLDVPVVFVETPVGQLAFRVAEPDRLRYFPDLRVVEQYPWDLHTETENYERLTQLIPMIPPGVLTYADPKLEPGTPPVN